MKGRKTTSEIRLPRFGSVVGLAFEDGGAAEILMTFPELRRILEAWQDAEAAKSHPDPKIISALDVLRKKALSVRTRFIAEVPIAQSRARIIPILE
jgi:hypothetical protein